MREIEYAQAFQGVRVRKGPCQAEAPQTMRIIPLSILKSARSLSMGSSIPALTPSTSEPRTLEIDTAAPSRPLRLKGGRRSSEVDLKKGRQKTEIMNNASQPFNPYKQATETEHFYPHLPSRYARTRVRSAPLSLRSNMCSCKSATAEGGVGSESSEASSLPPSSS